MREVSHVRVFKEVINPLVFAPSPPCRVESYSCKMVGNEKKQYKHLSHHQEGQNRQALSPPQTIFGSPLAGSPISNGLPAVLTRTISGSSNQSECGPQLRDAVDNKTLFFLKATLNLSFQPDYDFTNAKSEEFSREPNVKLVMGCVRSNLAATAGDKFLSFDPFLWAAIDEEIQLCDCDIYR